MHTSEGARYGSWFPAGPLTDATPLPAPDFRCIPPYEAQPAQSPLLPGSVLSARLNLTLANDLGQWQYGGSLRGERPLTGATAQVFVISEGEELPCDVVCVLSTQEEMGPRNSKVTVHHIHPDIAIVMEGCPADDTFTEPYAIQTALRKGPMFRHLDVSAICAPRYQRWALDLAAKKGIPVQESVRQGGGNNAASIQTALVGAPSIVAGVPVRYAHATDCISTEFDFEAVSVVKALDYTC